MLREMTWEELKSLEGFVLIDVREDWEWEEFHIEGAVHIPLGKLEERMKTLDKSMFYVLYCRTGSRSLVAQELFSRHGFRAVSLKGGIISLR